MGCAQSTQFIHRCTVARFCAGARFLSRTHSGGNPFPRHIVHAMPVRDSDLVLSRGCDPETLRTQAADEAIDKGLGVEAVDDGGAVEVDVSVRVGEVGVAGRQFRGNQKRVDE